MEEGLIVGALRSEARLPRHTELQASEARGLFLSSECAGVVDAVRRENGSGASPQGVRAHQAESSQQPVSPS